MQNDYYYTLYAPPGALRGDYPSRQNENEHLPERKNTDMNKQKTTNTHKYNHNTNGPDTGLPFTVKLKCDKIA